MKEIPLTRGKVALVDDEDYERVSKFKWHCTSEGYAATTLPRLNGHRKTVWMHRYIMNAPDGIEVDHVRSGGLDNRRENLRLASHTQNTMNRPSDRGSLSRYKGVSFFKDGKKWHAEIQAHGKRIYLGRFISEIDAAIAYNEAAKKHHGEFAVLNEVLS